MVRQIVIALVASVLGSVAAWAQDAKPVPLADYVSLCQSLWDASPDIPAKASALELQDMTGASAGAAITIGKTTLRLLKSARPHHTVGATTTTFADGKDFSCDINLPMPIERADLEAMEKALDLDGQIMTMGPTTMGRWKVRRQASPLLLKAIATKTSGVVFVQKFESTLALAKSKPAR
jgi:hypothetical protein